MERLRNKQVIRKSGVDSNIYSEYKFEDHHWIKNSPTYDSYIDLINYAIKINGIYHVRGSLSDGWSKFKTETDAIREAENKWQGRYLTTGEMVTSKLIHSFFKGELTNFTLDQHGKSVKENLKIGNCPLIENAFSIPLGPQYVTYNNFHYLNSWVDQSIAGDEKNIVYGKLILVMLYRNLCNGPILNQNTNIEADMLINQIASGSYTNNDFKFAMMWLAAVVQQPGINLVTNLWFVGATQGVGKGTLVKIMNLILGNNVCGSISESELKRGWNDYIVGRQLLNIDEFKTSKDISGGEWNNWLKQYTCEPSILITQRNFTPWWTFNIGNYIITANIEDINWLDQSDRRNHMIKTNDHSDAVGFAIEIRTNYVDRCPREVAAGFAWFLERVDVDYNFIGRAQLNLFKSGLLQNSIHEVGEWVQSDPLINRDTWESGIDLYDSYKSWMSRDKPGRQPLTKKSWDKLMATSESVGIFKKRTNQGAMYKISEPVLASAIDTDRAIASITQITNDIILNNESNIVPELDRLTQLTPLQKIRIKLIERDNEGGF